MTFWQIVMRTILKAYFCRQNDLAVAIPWIGLYIPGKSKHPQFRWVREAHVEPLLSRLLDFMPVLILVYIRRYFQIISGTLRSRQNYSYLFH